MNKPLKWILLAAAVCALICVANRLLIVSDSFDRADVIVILSGNDKDRIEKAAALYHAGKSESIMLTNTGQVFGEYSHPYTMLQKELLKELGVPEGAIYIADFRAKNTGQEATGIIEKMQEMSAHSVVIVTDALHTGRTKMIFDDSFANTGFTVYYCPAARAGFPLTPQNIRTVFGEYIRMIGYQMKKHGLIDDYPVWLGGAE